MRILLAAVTCEKGAHQSNLDTHLEVHAWASEEDCDLAVYPEMSLTGSVDAVRHPEHAVELDDDVVRQLVDATQTGVAASFGIGERLDGALFITQVTANDGRIVAAQRKRHLGEGEDGFETSSETARLRLAGHRVGTIICAESRVDHTWDASTSGGESLVLFASAPGLDERRTDEAGWRAGFEWWGSAGLADACRQARRLGVWVAMATQAGSTVDEDFPGIAALIAPSGEVVERLPDWRPGTLVVDVPLD